MAAKKKPQFDAYGLWQSIIKENQDLARAVSSNNRVESENAMVAISALYVAKSREVYGEDAIPLPEGVPIDVQKKIIACIEGTADVPSEDAEEQTSQDSPAVITPEVDPATETAVAQLRGEAVTVSNVEMDATILLAETRGVSQQAQFIETVSRMTMLTRLAHIKESKGYKGAKVRDANGELQSIKTWPEFCTALGMPAPVPFVPVP